MNLDVLIPSLLLPPTLQELISPPVVPALERLLARAGRHATVAPDAASWLCARWGIAAPCPVAAVVAAHDGLSTEAAGWMFAEPVHMVADRDAVKLYPGCLQITAQESQELIATLNAHFSGDGIAFYATVPQRWYVKCEPAEIPLTVSPDVARSAPLAENQPRSSGKLNWRALQNEAQMLLFTHPVNQRRDTSGKDTVNGLWFWGGGVAPDIARATVPAYESVLADTPLASQLALASGIRLSPPVFESLKSAEGDVLLVLDTCEQQIADRDLNGWKLEIERMDAEWFQPLSSAIRDGTITQLNIHVPDRATPASFHMTRAQQWLKFWRSTQPLGSYA